MKKLLCLALCLAACSPKKDTTHLISLQRVDRNGQTETISQIERVRLLEKQNYAKPQPYEKILRVYSKNKEGKNPSILTTYHDNGQLFQHLEASDGRAFGDYHEYYPTGTLRIQASVIEGSADLTLLAQSSWVFDGPCLVFYPDGTPEAKFTYQRGKKEGEAIYYYPHGNIQKKLCFHDDLAEGEIYEYFEEGMLSQITQFHQGKEQGLCKKYTRKGSVSHEELWNDGRLDKGAYYDLDGTLCSEIINGNGIKSVFSASCIETTLTYKEGIPEGKIELFNDKGQLESFYHISKNGKEGEEVIYFESSLQPKLSLNWHEDQISGLVKTFYINGALESQKTYQNNKKNGPSSVFYHQGPLMMLETYSQDKLLEGKYYKKGENIPSSTVDGGSGTALMFDEWGAVIQEITYDKGKVVLPDN